MAVISGTENDDERFGTNDADIFQMADGGNDTVYAMDGNDRIEFGDQFNIGDHVQGGLGFDTLVLGSSIPYGELHLHLKRTTLIGVEKIEFSGVGINHYVVRFADGNVWNHGAMIIDASTYGSYIDIDATRESGGDYIIHGSGNGFGDTLAAGGGDDFLYGGGGGDRLIATTGDDALHGDVGNDVLVFQGEGALTKHDLADGGDGFDTLELATTSSAVLNIPAGICVAVERLSLAGTGVWTVDLSHSGLGETGTYFVVTGQSDLARLNFTATGDRNAAGMNAYDIMGGDHDDAIVGSPGNDRLGGSRGIDELTGGRGADVYYWDQVNTSFAASMDSIDGFDAREDKLSFWVGGVPDAIDRSAKHGTVNFATFGSDVEAAVGAHRLHANDAVLFHADDGDYAGTWFVILDANGVGGFQANADEIVRLFFPEHLGAFSVDSFIAG